MEKSIIDQARELVRKLNDEASERGGFEHYLPYTFKDQGWICYIEFMGEILWDSDNDDRDYIDENEEQESLENHILKLTLRMINDLNMKLGLSNDWIDVCDDDPHCYREGDWDGLMSDEVLVKATDGKLYIARCYKTASGIARDVYTYYDSTGCEIEVDSWKRID